MADDDRNAGLIIPQQKKTFLENLESKARGICASLQDVTAGAIVTEDYSSVVDYAGHVLRGAGVYPGGYPAMPPLRRPHAVGRRADQCRLGLRRLTA